MTSLSKQLISDIFYISLITYVVYFVVELIKEGLVSNYFDLNLLLLWTVIFAILEIIINKKKFYDRWC